MTNGRFVPIITDHQRQGQLPWMDLQRVGNDGVKLPSKTCWDTQHNYKLTLPAALLAYNLQLH